MNDITKSAIGVLIGLALTGLAPRTTAADTNDELKAVKEQLQVQGQQIQELQKGATAGKIQPVGPGSSEDAAAQRNFVMVGGADVLYQKRQGGDGSFSLGHFSPVFLFRAQDNILFESEVELEIDGSGEPELGIEYAQMDYLVNDYLTLIAGRFVLPLGVGREKLDASWINKLPIQPLTLADGTGLIPENDIGVQARGGFHVTDAATLTYALYVSDGPGDGTAAGDTNGMVFDNGSDLSDFGGNGEPSYGGRLATFYPWAANHDVELGVSGQTGPWSADGNQTWSALAGDAALHFTPNLELRGEYIKTWQEMADEGTVNRDGWWAQAAYKLAGLDLDLPVINNLEAVFRAGGETLPEGHVREYDIGPVYHISNTLLVKGAYSFFQSNIHDFGEDHIDLDKSVVTIQTVFGF